ncbi:MAG: CHAT domain-containing protein [bacterium]|nr:CHAT domain-containing protein [bacterium]
MSDDIAKLINQPPAEVNPDSDYEIYLKMLLVKNRADNIPAMLPQLHNLLETDPTNLIWICCGCDFLKVLQDEAYNNLLQLLPNDTESLAGLFKIAQLNVNTKLSKQSSDKIWNRRMELPPEQRLFFTRYYAKILFRNGQQDKAIQLLKDNITNASSASSRLLEAFYWYRLSDFLYKMDDDNAIHAGLRCWKLLAPYPENQISATIHLAKIVASRMEYEASIRLLDTAIADANNVGNLFLSASAAVKASSICDNMSQKNLSLNYNHISLRNVIELKDYVNIPRVMVNLSYFHRNNGDIDSSLYYLKQAELYVNKYNNAGNKLLLPMHMAEFYYFIGDYAKADSLINVANSRSNKSGTTAVDKALIYLNIIEQGLETNSPDAVYRSINRFKELKPDLYNNLPDQNLIAKYELASAIFSMQQGEWQLAQDALDRAETALNGINAEQMLYRLSNCRGILSLSRNDIDSANKHFSESCTLAKTSSAPELLASSILALGKTMLKKGESQKALDLFLGHDSDNKLISFKTRLDILLNTGLSYLALENYNEAIAILDTGLDLCDNLSPADIKASLYIAKANCVIDSNQKLAKEYLFSATKTMHETSNNQRHGYNYEILKQIAGLTAKADMKLNNKMSGLNSLKSVLNILHQVELADLPAISTIFYLAGEDQSYCWYINNGFVTLKLLPGNKELSLIVESIVANPESSILGASLVLPDNMETDKLCIIPDQMLSAIPWYALPVSDTELIIDKLTLVELPLWTHLDNDYCDIENPKLLAIGVNTAADLPELNEAETEARAIFDFWPAESALLLTGEDANLGNSPESLLSKYQVIHIASHVTVHQGMSSHSTIRLADAHKSSPLTITSISNMSLDAELVYLSSCESSRVISSNGTMTSFTSAFLEAGVNNVIASSTRIDDQFGKQTAELFYQFWTDGYTKPEALRKALLTQRNNRNWADTRFWGFLKIYGRFN